MPLMTLFQATTGKQCTDAQLGTAMIPQHANLINTTGVLHDHDQRTIFWKGGSKDIRDVTQWEWTSGAVPDKDEISHAGAAAYKVNSDLIMYIFADRFSNDGDAEMGAWFFQDAVDTVENPNRPGQGSFSGRHKNGDILWLGHFSGGWRDCLHASTEVERPESARG